MDPTIHIEGSIGRSVPRAHIVTRLKEALRRLAVRPAWAHVRFSDTNGPKGGNDIRCALDVALPHQPPAHVEHDGATPRVAFDASYGRLVRQLERSRERRQDARRHPKKYYAASRLLWS